MSKKLRAKANQIKHRCRRSCLYMLWVSICDFQLLALVEVQTCRMVQKKVEGPVKGINQTVEITALSRCWLLFWKSYSQAVA